MRTVLVRMSRESGKSVAGNCRDGGSTTADNALLLEVLAGADGHDPRQQDVVAQPYRPALTGRSA